MKIQHRDAHSPSPEHTKTLAETLAPTLRKGDLVLLSGPIGAGKSHFTRSAIQSLLPVPEDVPSPTYTLVQTYTGKTAEIWHADLYRLSDASEIHELGLWAAFDDAICFVEWPDRLGNTIPERALYIAIKPGLEDDARLLRFSWSDHRWDARVKGVFGDRSVTA